MLILTNTLYKRLHQEYYRNFVTSFQEKFKIRQVLTRAIHTGVEEQYLFWRTFYFSSIAKQRLRDRRITEAHVQTKWKMCKIAMNNSWDNKVSDHQNNMVLKRGSNNLPEEVESHHQLVKDMSGLQANIQDCTQQQVPLQKAIPKANLENPTARNVKSSPQCHLFCAILS